MRSEFIYYPKDKPYLNIPNIDIPNINNLASKKYHYYTIIPH